jgi:hypothetical protein
MTTGNRWPQVGDLAVDYQVPGSAVDHPRAGDTVSIREITSTLIITSDHRKYDRRWMAPLNEGRYSARTLIPATDRRVLTARGRTHLFELARLVENLALIDYRAPEGVVAALAQIMTTANESRVALVALMAEASRAERESNR